MSFSSSFNLQINGQNVSHNSKGKRGLTAQEEYWLNRFSRKYSGWLIFFIILFFVLMGLAIVYGDSSSQTTKVNVININSSSTTSTSTSSSKIIINH